MRTLSSHQRAGGRSPFIDVFRHGNLHAIKFKHLLHHLPRHKFGVREMTLHSAPLSPSCLSLTETRGNEGRKVCRQETALQDPPATAGAAAPNKATSKGVVRLVTSEAAGANERGNEGRCRSNQLFLSNKIRSSFYLSPRSIPFRSRSRRRGGGEKGREGEETNCTIQTRARQGERASEIG